MRPLVWWVQDHLGLAAVGLLGVAAVVVAIVIATSGGSSEAPRQPSKVAAGGAPGSGEAQAVGGSKGVESSAPAQQGGASAAHRHAHRQAARAGTTATAGAPKDEATAKAKSSAPGKNLAGHADGTAAQPPKSHQASEPAAQNSLGQATAEKVAAAHPGTSCPKSYSRKQCEEAVQAAAAPAPTVAVTQPTDCTKAMSEAQCEELFAAEAAAREAGSGSISPQECIEHPEQERCAAVVEQMKAQYEAAHPGG